MAVSRILVTGANGQVGRRICEWAEQSRISADLITRTNWDLAKPLPKNFIQRLKDHKTEALIHCAGYTAVDRAEDDLSLLNVTTFDASLDLARAALELDLPFYFFSTDYVFSGKDQIGPYHENSKKHPLNAYGHAKSKTENALLELSIKSGLRLVILRTQWVYDCYGKNFLKTILQKLKSGEVVRVVDDQVGQTTWARDLGRLVIEMLNRDLDLHPSMKSQPILHLRQMGEEISWADFAEAIAEEGIRDGIVSRDYRIARVKSSEFSVRAERPKFSTLAIDKALSLGVHPMEWREALSNCFDEGREEFKKL